MNAELAAATRGFTKGVLGEALHALGLFFRPWKSAAELVRTWDDFHIPGPDAGGKSQSSAPSQDASNRGSHARVQTVDAIESVRSTEIVNAIEMVLSAKPIKMTPSLAGDTSGMFGSTSVRERSEGPDLSNIAETLSRAVGARIDALFAPSPRLRSIEQPTGLERTADEFITSLVLTTPHHFARAYHHYVADAIVVCGADKAEASRQLAAYVVGAVGGLLAPHVKVHQATIAALDRGPAGSFGGSLHDHIDLQFVHGHRVVLCAIKSDSYVATHRKRREAAVRVIEGLCGSHERVYVLDESEDETLASRVRKARGFYVAHAKEKNAYELLGYSKMGDLMQDSGSI